MAPRDSVRVEFESPNNGNPQAWAPSLGQSEEGPSAGRNIAPPRMLGARAASLSARGRGSMLGDVGSHASTNMLGNAAAHLPWYGARHKFRPIRASNRNGTP